MTAHEYKTLKKAVDESEKMLEMQLGKGLKELLSAKQDTLNCLNPIKLALEKCGRMDVNFIDLFCAENGGKIMAKIEELKKLGHGSKRFLFDVVEKEEGKIFLPYVGLREGRLEAISPSEKYAKIYGGWYKVEEIEIRELLE